MAHEHDPRAHALRTPPRVDPSPPRPAPPPTDDPRLQIDEHGIGWIVMSLLCVDAVRRRVIPLWLGVMVAVVGGVGPFAGTIGFVYAERRPKAAPRIPQRDMV